MSEFTRGLICGMILGSVLTTLVSSAQFYPGIDPQMRDMQLQQMYQQQQDHQNQQRTQQEWQKPC